MNIKNNKKMFEAEIFFSEHIKTNHILYILNTYVIECNYSNRAHYFEGNFSWKHMIIKKYLTMLFFCFMSFSFSYLKNIICLACRTRLTDFLSQWARTNIEKKCSKSSRFFHLIFNVLKTNISNVVMLARTE